MSRVSPWPALLLGGLAVVTTACDGPQSALDPAGRDAETIAALWWWMAGGAAVVWLVVVGLAVYALRVRPGEHSERGSYLLIVGGGVAFPTVVLGALLAYGLATMPAILAPAPEGGLVIEVTGEQWWWRVRYLPPGGEPVELANEVRLAVGERLNLELRAADVIHAFWVPALGGKMDMIPGRTTRLSLEPTRTGTFRGQCAEYCGASHARMAFHAVVAERREIDAWLAHQASPAAEPTTDLARRGRDVFGAHGCGACHTVRGAGAEAPDGVVGPDLTHVGSRVSLGAASLPNDVDGFRRFLSHPGRVKPGVHMPSFRMLGDDDLDALAAYLEGLQ